MTYDAVIVVSLLCANLAVVIIMLLLAIFRADEARASRFMYAFIFAVCPVVGVLAFGFSRLIALLFREKRLDSSNLTFDTNRAEAILPPDESTELNYMPIKDAMVTQESGAQRRLLLDLLKNRAVISEHSVNVAVKSDDAETSHYAASAVTDFLSEFRSGAQQYLFRLKQAPRDAQAGIEALAYLHRTLSMHVMDDIEQRSYAYTMDGVAESMYENNRWFMTSEHYLWMTDIFLEIGDIDAAAKWRNRANKCRPGELETYKCDLHYYFDIRDKAAFFRILEDVKKSNVWIDREILDLIRTLNAPGKE